MPRVTLLQLSPSFRSHLALVGLVLVSGAALAQSEALPNRKDPLAGITTSGQPSAEALAAAAADGYAAVIDLRVPAEDRGLDEQAAVEALGMTYINLPVDGAAGVTFANAKALDSLLAEVDGPVIVHCSSGNRAGALLALRASLKGADPDAALQLGLASGLGGLRPTVEAKLAAAQD